MFQPCSIGGWALVLPTLWPQLEDKFEMLRQLQAIEVPSWLIDALYDARLDESR